MKITISRKRIVAAVATVIFIVALVVSLFSFNTAAVAFPIDNTEFTINPDDIFIEVFINHDKLIIEWDTFAQRNRNYFVRVFNADANAASPFFTEEVSGAAPYVDVYYESGITSFRIDLAYADVIGNNASNVTETYNDSLILSKTISLNNGVMITSSADGLTGSSQAIIEYNVPRSITAELSVDGRHDIISLNGAGSFSIELSSAQNMVAVQYVLDDPNVVYSVNFEILVQAMPPMLLLPEHKTPVYVDADEFTLTGVTNSGVFITVADTSVDVDSDGIFIHTVKLNSGENIIKVTAADAFGNAAEQNVIINRIDDIKGADAVVGGNSFWAAATGYLPLMLSFLGSIILIAAVIFISRGFEKSPEKKLYVLKSSRNIAAALTSICIAAGGYCIRQYLMLRKLSESEDYFTIVRESIDNAYEILRDFEFYETLLKNIGIAVGSGIFLIVVLSLIIKFMKKNP